MGLLSGGLDSILAVRVMLDQGITVTPLNIQTGLTYERRNRLISRESTEQGRAEQAARLLELDLVTIRAFEDYIPVILDPKHGYGSQMNPCVDCRIYLLRQAKRWMEEHDHQFVFTGEVLGQRPNSQLRHALKIVEQESGLEGLLLRPLSAKLLQPTTPVKRGWVQRENLYDFQGRSRRPQIALAERLGITEYPQPAGGCCFLVDATFSRRLRDFLGQEGRRALTTERALLLAVGRHLRLPSHRRVVVGRDQGENAYIATLRDQGVLMTTIDEAGPTTLVTGNPTAEDINHAARITARYSRGRDKAKVRVQVLNNARWPPMAVVPLAARDVETLMI